MERREEGRKEGRQEGRGLAVLDTPGLGRFSYMVCYLQGKYKLA
jgi:hypothetical protein